MVFGQRVENEMKSWWYFENEMVFGQCVENEMEFAQCVENEIELGKCVEKEMEFGQWVRIRVMMFNITVNKISLVEEVPGENHRPAASHLQTLSH